jgi:diguanylate cyclase (GGDEF)-like protein
VLFSSDFISATINPSPARVFVKEEELLRDDGGTSREYRLDLKPDVVLLVEPDARTAVWIGEMLRAAWDRDLVVAHAQRLGKPTQELFDHAVSCALIDVSGLEDEPIAAVEQIRAAMPSVAIVLLCDEVDEEQALAALAAGAQDCLAKPDLSPGLLRRTVKFAIEGRRAEAQLAHQALHDPLTGLPNRALFLDRLGVALDRSRRSATSLAVLFLDIDNFKNVNDTFGHHAGDQVLIGLGGRLKVTLRPMDSVARFGGDEFTLLLEDLDDEREVVAIAQRITDSLEVPFRLNDSQVTLTVSIGIAIVADPAVAPDTVIQEADAAMYRAKERGRARFELFDEASRQRAMERLEMESALRNALERRELLVHYQPQVSLSDRPGFIGLEALVRWQHPRLGLIGPREFIPLAEETGLIVAIGRYVLESALAQMAAWQRVRPDIILSVNVSSYQLEDLGLPSMLAAATQANAVDPAALRLEVTEATVAHCHEAAVTALQVLEGTGIRLAIDDFGTGSSSLQAIKRLPIDTIKIHESLLASSTEERPVLGAAVGIGHALGLRVIAEGVETEQQLDELRALGCDGAQGFLFSRPVPEDEVEQLLAATAASGGGERGRRRRWFRQRPSS